MCLMLELAKQIYSAVKADPLYVAGPSPAQGTTDLRIRKEDGELKVEVEGSFGAEQVLDLLPASIEIKGNVNRLLLDFSQVNLVDTISLSAIFVVLRKHTKMPVRLRLANLSDWVLRQLLLTPEPEFLEGLWGLEVRAGTSMLNIWPSRFPSSRCAARKTGH